MWIGYIISIYVKTPININSKHSFTIFVKKKLLFIIQWTNIIYLIL